VTLTEENRQAPTCRGCGVAVECCAFCEQDDCTETICYRCLRTQFRESLPQPHIHGG
jgi:hypothetical protein